MVSHKTTLETKFLLVCTNLDISAHKYPYDSLNHKSMFTNVCLYYLLFSGGRPVLYKCSADPKHKMKFIQKREKKIILTNEYCNSQGAEWMVLRSEKSGNGKQMYEPSF